MARESSVRGRPGRSSAWPGLPLRHPVRAAALYLVASRRFPVLRDQAVICGLSFGVGIYLFMNFVVVPLSAVPFEFKYTPAKLARDLLVHTCLVGPANRARDPALFAHGGTAMSDVAFQPDGGHLLLPRRSLPDDGCADVRALLSLHLVPARDRAPLSCSTRWSRRSASKCWQGSPLVDRHAVE